MRHMQKTAYYHLPGLFEFYELYRIFLPLFREHREYFYDGCDIGSIYGAPPDCIWGGGRVSLEDHDAGEVLALLQEYGISARLTFSNSKLIEEHLSDRKCNELCALFAENTEPKNGVIVHSELLLQYLKSHYPQLYLISSTTKVLTDFEALKKETDREDFRYVVPDFRLNKAYEKLNTLTESQKDKVEFLCNECCYFGCKDRKECYEAVSRRNLGEEPDFSCTSPGAEEGYRFSKAMKNPGFISVGDIQKIYLPMGFSNYKIEGRGLGSALVLEFLLYYMTKPEYQLQVREEIYLDNKDRKECYEAVSRRNLGEEPDFSCTSPGAEEGYRFSKAMKNPGFISVGDIQKIYLPMGFSNYKIEGRGLGSALVLEFLLYYMTKPEYQLQVREEIYLDNMLDLF